MATILTVATEGELRAAIFQVSNDFANGVDNGPYTIDIVAEFLTLTQSLPMIRGTVPTDGSAQITIIGNGFIDANFSGRVFFVESGAVAINGLVILNARAEGGAGGDGASSGGAGGGGLGAGAAVFVNDGAVVTLTNVQFDGASAVGGAGGDGGALGLGFGFGSGGGGGLGGNGGDAGGAGSGGGGGYAGTGGQGSDAAGGGGGGEFGSGGAPVASGTGGGGGGGQQGNGGAGAIPGGGGGGGGATQEGADGVGTTGGAGGGLEGGDGGDAGAPGEAAEVAPGHAGGGGGGGGATAAGGFAVASGGGGGMGNDFNHTGGNGGFGGGGGGAPTSALAGTGGNGAFGAGGGSGTTGGASLGFGGQGGSGSGADGGGGAALGGAVFVRDGGTLIINDGNFAGSYGVSGGTTGGAGGATAGQAHGSLMFLHGGSTTTFNVSADNEVTFGVGGSPAPTAGTGGVAKTGLGTLIFGQVHGYTGATVIEEGLARIDGSVASSAFTVENGGTVGGTGTTGSVFVASGGALAPGASAGTLTVSGNLTSTLGATYRVEIAGTAPGAFDRVSVTGTASLGNATLDLALLNFDATPGNSFTILQAAGGVSGIFFGLADLAQFSAGGDTFQIDYTATAIVLTAVSIPLTLTGLAPSVTMLESATDAQPQILDAEVALTGDSFAGGSLTVSGLLAGDTVGIRHDGFDPGQIGVDSGIVFYGGVAIGTVAGGVGADLTVAFNGSVTKAAVEAVIEHLTYFSAAEPPAASRTLTLTVIDASAATVDADIVVNVTAQNDAPVNTVPDEPLTVAEDTDLPITGLSVSDADSGPADIIVTLTVQHGMLTVDATVSGGLNASEITGNGTGTVTLTGDPTVNSTTLAAGVIYRGALNYNGPDTLTMTSNDGGSSGADPGLTGDASSEEDIDNVFIDVTPVNDGAPVAVDDALSSVAEDSAPRAIAAAELLANDSRAPDFDETLVITDVSNPVGGSVVLNGDGSVTFTPAANFNGAASFDYVVNDGTSGNDDTGHVTFSVTPVSDAPPTAGDDALSAVAEDSGARIIAAAALLANDSAAPDTGETLSITGVSNPVGGTVALNGDGSVTFTPSANFNGPTSFDYVLNDGTPGSNDTGHVTFNVTPVSDAPVITSNGGGDTANVSVLERTAAVTTVVADDPDTPSLIYSIVGGSNSAKFQINASTGALSFVKAPNFDVPTDVDHNNSYIVQVRASDGTLSDDQTLTVQVTDDPNVTSTVHWIQSVDAGPHPAGWLPAGTGDFNGDGTADLAWFNSATGNLDIWKLSNGAWAGSSNVGSHPPGYRPVGFSDYNNDGTDDVLWYNPTTRDVDLWKISNAQWAGSVNIGTHPAGFEPTLSGDFNGDGTSDILWYNSTTNAVDIWKIDSNGQWAGSVDVGPHPLGWKPLGAADFNLDGTTDIAWHNPTNNNIDIWLIKNGQWAASFNIGSHPPGSAATPPAEGAASVPIPVVAVGVGDFDHNGVADIMWQDTGSNRIDNWLLAYS